MYFLGGKVESLEEVKARATPSERTLVWNMEVNKYAHIVTSPGSAGWVSPLEDQDVVLNVTF